MIIHAASNSINLSIPLSATQSLAEFRKWVYSDNYPQEGKYTYFQTEVFLDLAAEKANAHAELKTAIIRDLGSFVQRHDLGKAYGDGMWFTNDAADVSNEPDGMFISWSSFETGKIELVKSKGSADGIEYQGTPDWVLEVVSNSSVEKDTKWLPQAYHAAKIPEFWLIDGHGKQIEFWIHVWQEGKYEVRSADESGVVQSDLFGTAVQLTSKT